MQHINLKYLKHFISPTNSTNSTNSTNAFTLIELLIVTGILAVLTASVVAVLNPAQMLKQARDSTRMQDLASMSKSIQTLQALDPNISLGVAKTVYVSIPDTSSTCGTLGLPALSTGYTYHCVTNTNLHNTDGTGWVPVNFSDSLVAGVGAISSLPIDSTNSTTTGLYFTYATNGTGRFKLTASFESEKYIPKEAKDGGIDANRYEVGTSLALTLGTPPASACGSTLTDTRNNEVYNTVLIGTQCWMKENINIGTMIAGTVASTDNGIIEKYCYNDSSTICNSDGGLYQWGEAMQYAPSCNGTASHPACTTPVQGICPSGWHIPSHYEFTQLERAVCTSSTCDTDFPYDTVTTGWRGTDEGTKLKVGGSSGFEGILTGYRNTSGSFDDRGVYTTFWSSLESGALAWLRYLISGYSSVGRFTLDKLYGFSVRCLED